MSIFKNYTVAWWQVSMLKISVFCVGVAVGANWPEIFAGYTTLLLAVAVILAICLSSVLFKK